MKKDDHIPISLLINSSVFFGVKDLEGKYITLNNKTLKTVGYTNIDQAVGKTDFDLPCAASEFAHIFQQQDTLAVQKNGCTTVDIHRYAVGTTCFLNSKEPYSVDGKVVGSIFTGIEVKNNLIKNMLYTLIANDHKKFNIPKFGSYTVEQNVYHDLTTREVEVLFHTIRGRSAKTTAVLLGISRKAVEHQLECLKNKFGVYSKSQLIEDAINKGFLFNFPSSIISV